MANRVQAPHRRKRRVREHKESPFPVPIATITGVSARHNYWFYYTGELQNDHVIVKHSGDVTFLYKMGFFGKGLLSRGAPDLFKALPSAHIPDSYGDTEILKVMRRRMYLRHRQWQKSHDQQLANENGDAASDGNSVTLEDQEFDSDIEYDEGQYAGEIGQVFGDSSQTPNMTYNQDINPDWSVPMSCDQKSDTRENPENNFIVFTSETEALQKRKTEKVVDAGATWEGSEVDTDFSVNDNSAINKSKVSESIFGIDTWNKPVDDSIKQVDDWDAMEADADFWGTEETSAAKDDQTDRKSLLDEKLNETKVKHGTDLSDDVNKHKRIENEMGQSSQESSPCKRARYSNVDCDTTKLTTTVKNIDSVCDMDTDSGTSKKSELKQQSNDDWSRNSKTNNLLKSENSLMSKVHGNNDRKFENENSRIRLRVMSHQDSISRNDIEMDATVNKTVTYVENEAVSVENDHWTENSQRTENVHSTENDHITENDHRAGKVHSTENNSSCSSVHENSSELDNDKNKSAQEKQTTIVISEKDTETPGSTNTAIDEAPEIHPYCTTEDVDGDYLVIDDSDCDDSMMHVRRNHKYSWKPVRKKDAFTYTEPLVLSYEEAFFLSYGLGCLTVLNDARSALSLTDLWCRFCKRQRFLPNYVAYHYFRSKGWVPRPGVLFGSDFVLYRIGPPFFHGSYSVVVKVVYEDTYAEVEEYTDRKLTWTTFSGLNRVTEHVAKTLMYCYVIMPRDLTDDEKQSPACLARFKIRLQVINRWVSSQEREREKATEIPDD